MMQKIIISKEMALNEALFDTLGELEILLLKFIILNDELTKHVHETKDLLQSIHETSTPNP